MNMAFDADERVLLSEAGRIFEHLLPLSRLRDGDDQRVPWREIGAGGWLHAGVPESLGGAEQPLPVIAGLGRAAGAAAGGEEFVANAVVIPALLVGVDAPADERMALLADQLERPGFVIGDGRGFDLVDADPPGARRRWCFGVWPGFDGYAVRSAGSKWTLTRVDPGQIVVRELAGLALGTGDVEMAAGGHRVLDLCLGHEELGQLQASAAVVHAATLCGLASTCIGLTVGHVKDRRQFGVPLGSFQAVKHRLADAHAATTVAWNATLAAAVQPTPLAVRIAHLQAAEAAREAATAMAQLHGGIGFTWEHDAHLLLKVAVIGACRFEGVDDAATWIGEHLVDGAATA